jgi:hypothetical protein
MKKLKCLTWMLLLPAGLAPLFPCDVYAETARAAGKDKVQVKLFVELVHRRCPVDIEKTRLAPAGVTIDGQSRWQKVAAGLYRKDLVVSLSEKAGGEIRVLRDCPKTGRQLEVLGIARI